MGVGSGCPPARQRPVKRGTVRSRSMGGLITAALCPHPATPYAVIDRVEVEVERLGDVGVKLRYRAYGDMSRLRLPSFETAARADELWKHTCFEAFVRADDRDEYLELNFAGLQWASYRFDGYREGMREASVAPWTAQGWLRDDHFELEVEIDIGRMARPDLPAPDWQMGLSAVIEDTNGTLTYWALAHPSDKPDFHHPDSFTLVLPAPEAP